ncbi:MAG TPA: amino acid ABC transporter permease [bacterium]|nr:amino acid ABC transporter permease [bacterium]
MLRNFVSLFDFRASVGYLPDLAKGALVSVELTVTVMALSLVFGLFVALARITRLKSIRAVATIYMELIRGTPALLQLFYVYFVLPVFGIRFPPFTAGVIGLTLNYSAYLSEVYRAGIQAVAKGQLEAAQALGMSRMTTMRLIILPQAIRIVVPPLGNYFIGLFKDTALASIITVKELFFSGQIVSSVNYQYFTVFTLIGLFYLALSYPGSLGVQFLERRLRIGTRRQPPASTARVPQEAV